MDIQKKKLPNRFIMGTTKTSEEFLTQYYLVLRSFSFSNPFFSIIAFLYLTGKYLLLLHHPELLNKTLMSMANDQK